MRRSTVFRTALALSFVACTLPLAALGAEGAGTQGGRFTIAVIPDTQNYVDYTHQTAEGFPLDARTMFFEQMQYIADHTVSQGGDIAFVSAVGDVWQHQTLEIDPGHAARGFKAGHNWIMEKEGFLPTPKVKTVEIPFIKAGYDKIAGKVPFSVVPGNHDSDAMWTDINHLPPKTNNEEEAFKNMLLHTGGWSNFRSAFGDDTPYFKNKSWYIASHDGGADSAQIFTAGGYRFLHIGLQFDPPNESLEWAASIIRSHPGLPTIIATHDYLNTDGERRSNPIIDNHVIDPNDNNPEMMWQKLISQNDQIFLVVCGHEHAQAFRNDANAFGHRVYQILADYQGRKQTAIEAGATLRQDGLGDGWMRLMMFDLGAATPSIHVRTYSTHYNEMSVDEPNYVQWYKGHEKPNLSDEAFVKGDDFVIDLVDFRQRFDKAAKVAVK